MSRILVMFGLVIILASSDPLPPVQIFILAGQSNMRGYGANYHPGLAFAERLNQIDPLLNIQLIQCAKDSSSILQWQRGSTLYSSCLKKVNQARGEVMGLLFYQGESDAMAAEVLPEIPKSLHDYAEMFEAFIPDIREDLQSPDLPVIYAQIGSNAEWKTRAL